MAAPTNLEVSVDSVEYSRYESTANTITATVVDTGGGTYTSENIRIELVKARRARDSVVASSTEIISGAEPQTVITTFYLPDIVDQDQLNLVRHGKYFVRATSVTNNTVIGESSDFDIRVMTVNKFKDDYLFGIRLNSTEIKYVKYQPTNITGVTITEVSKASKTGFGVLTYTYNAMGPVRTISWNSGTAVTISAPGTFLLKGGALAGPFASLNMSADYIVIKITSLGTLPTSNKTDDILIEEKTISDSVIADYLDKAIAYIETEVIWSYLEPTVITTDTDPLNILYSSQSPINAPLYANYDYDVIVRPLSYIASRSSYITINSNFNQLLRVDSLFGVIGGSRVMDVDLSWLQISIAGMINLVPVNAQFNQYFLSLLWNGSFYSQGYIPSFWHLVAVQGLRDVTADLKDYMAKKAAIDLLGLLGAAYRPGISNINISRDGVSEGLGLNTTQKYGIYNGLISLYMDQLKILDQRIRAIYKGTSMMVV